MKIPITIGLCTSKMCNYIKIHTTNKKIERKRKQRSPCHNDEILATTMFKPPAKTILGL
jgi:hypothetical protein